MNMSNHKPVYVTRPYLPEVEEFTPYLERIWKNGILTNGGPLHAELEQALAEYLGVAYVSLFANGTLALIVALQALELSGEIITTPYSFVATAHAISWSGSRPVFVDVETDTFNIDPEQIEAAITDKTSAILAVHCYGNPARVDAIQSIADRHGLSVIYDAAHAFAVRDDGGSVLRHGDLSVLSFHATKVFHTFEGGAIVCSDEEMKKRIDRLKNFGFSGETSVLDIGINAKMSEVHAAMGLLQLKYIPELIQRREQIAERYRSQLAGIDGIRCLPLVENVAANYSYFPILVDPVYGESRDALYERLKGCGILARRYFYPLLSDFSVYSALPSAERSHLPVAAEASDRVLCLPIYPDLTMEDQDRVIQALKRRIL